jgi:hypothetical protein
MPKRTNAFQRLATILHEELGDGWEVSESEFLRDSITGELREVDVVAKGIVLGYEILISVECRDHVRRADVTWVEGMAKKHESLPTSKLVLWSRSGFSRPALAKASALKIDCVSHADAAKAPWALIARKMVGSAVELLTPVITSFVDVESLDKGRVRIVDAQRLSLLDAEGSPVTTVENIMLFLRGSRDIGETILNHSVPGTQQFYIEYRPQDPRFVDDGNGNYLRVVRVGFGVQAHVEKVRMLVASAAWKEKVVTLGTGKVERGRFELLVEEVEGEQPKARAVFKLWQTVKPKDSSGIDNE